MLGGCVALGRPLLSPGDLMKTNLLGACLPCGQQRSFGHLLHFVEDCSARQSAGEICICGLLGKSALPNRIRTIRAVEDGSAFDVAMLLMVASIVGIIVIQPEKLMYPDAKTDDTSQTLLWWIKSALLVGSLIAVAAVIGAMADWGVSYW